MNIFLNAVSEQGYICLFDSKRNIVASHTFQLLGNESSKLIGLVDDFLQDQNIAYSQIRNIATVVGPGSFTGIRTIVLFVNTLAFTYRELNLTAVDYFDLFDSYPIVKQSSRRDMFVKKQKNAIIEILSNQDFFEYVQENNLSCIYGHIGQEQTDFDICSSIDYGSYIQDLKLDTKKTLVPLYIKKPNIT